MPVSGIKDPRLCRLFPLWTPVFAEAGVEPCVVLCLRSPIAVAGSLLSREGLPPNQGLLIRLSYTVDAVRYSRGMRRTVVEYDALLADTKGTLDRVASVHGIVWPSPAGRLDEFLDKGLRHHGAKDDLGRDLDPRLLSLANRITASLGALAAAPSSPVDPALDAELAKLTEEWDQLVPSFKGWRQSWETATERTLKQKEEQAERAHAELRKFKSEMEASLVYRTRMWFLRMFPLGSRRHGIVHGVANAVMSPFVGSSRPS